ncbi:uncharacterized protein LOC127663256 [Xyrauchen texanus]|uniref:uncharacterized protein LOC127663256 n=1 Tax=Xyrauchen texanus TaxID=154827 RepID=UPI002242B270|nr:uncharacterized protein LOC127663256 [Xyrauchen texanus]
MKVSVCVVFAAACWLVAQAGEPQVILTLSKVMNEIKKLNKGTVNNSSNLMNSPITGEIKDCCIASALECFRSNVIYLNVKDANVKKSQKIIHNELRKTFIKNSVSSCSQKEILESQCKSCDSYPMVDGRTYVQNFQTLLNMKQLLEITPTSLTSHTTCMTVLCLSPQDLEEPAILILAELKQGLLMVLMQAGEGLEDLGQLGELHGTYFNLSRVLAPV